MRDFSNDFIGVSLRRTPTLCLWGRNCAQPSQSAKSSSQELTSAGDCQVMG